MLQNIIKEQEDSYHLKKLNTSLDGHKGSLLEVSQAETVPTCRFWLDSYSSNWWVSHAWKYHFATLKERTEVGLYRLKDVGGRRLAQARTCLRRAGPTCRPGSRPYQLRIAVGV